MLSILVSPDTLHPATRQLAPTPNRTSRPFYLPSRRTMMPTLSPEDHRTPPRVLLADRDPASRLIYGTTFHDAGYDVGEASDGREALTKALVRQPSLLVTELQLPLIDGVGLCEILRSDRLTANVPVLVATSETRFPEVQRIWRAGADVVLSKPTTPTTLLNEARRLIQQSHDLRGRTAAARARFAKQLEKSALLLARSGDIRARRGRTLTTTTPPVAPSELRCPSCYGPLRYEYSHVGGRESPEQWDYFLCAACGVFHIDARTNSVIYAMWMADGS